MSRIILHVDLDAFYASVEEREHPDYKGKPVVVGADPKGGAARGVVSTCNYAARKFGIRSAMPISIAYRKCPDAIFVPVNMQLYIEVSGRIMQLLRKHADKFEQVSIDEAYLDVSRLKSYERARGLAIGIKKEILKQEGLTCSVGIGPNKLIAKVASDYKKPDGLTVVPPGEAWDFLSPQSIRVLRGVGPKTEAILNQNGIKTVSNLRRVSKEQLVENFGAFGESLYEQARGRYFEELVEEWEIKSIGRQTTFEKDTQDKKFLLETMDALIRDVWADVQREGVSFKTVTVKVRYADFDTYTKQKSLIDHVNNIEAIQNIATELLEGFLKDPRKIRLIGVSVHQLRR